MEYYTLQICGLTRQLPISHISKKTRLASFSILGDVELVDKLADDFAKKLKDKQIDYVVGTEVKAVPLLHGVALRLGHKRFMVCRKTVKPYMIGPVILKPLSHFPSHVKQLVLNGQDAVQLKGKRVVIIDDVISTGVTMRMMKKMMEKVGAKVVSIMVVLKQGEQFDKDLEFSFVAELPIFQVEAG
ncbi:MAG: phosphoribosyltransferase family protein [Patescibacteria group bacterium]|nr:adenine phosphoribosyltransferase [Patescibacteria group bacterium]